MTDLPSACVATLDWPLLSVCLHDVAARSLAPVTLPLALLPPCPLPLLLLQLEKQDERLSVLKATEESNASHLERIMDLELEVGRLRPLRGQLDEAREAKAATVRRAASATVAPSAHPLHNGIA